MVDCSDSLSTDEIIQGVVECGATMDKVPNLRLESHSNYIALQMEISVGMGLSPANVGSVVKTLAERAPWLSTVEATRCSITDCRLVNVISQWLA
jgi:hypothetical protein